MPTIPAEKVQPLVRLFTQWTIGHTGSGEVLSKAHFDDRPARNYALFNPNPRRFLQYEDQTWGINLGWTDDASEATGQKVARWFFAKPNGTGGPVRYGDRIALANGRGRSFLRHEGRTFGIDLDWSGPPIYEWRILGGPTGTPVRQGELVAILNLKIREFFVYFDRNIGADIGYSDSHRWEDILPEPLRALIKEYGDDAVKAAVVAAMSA